MLKYEKVAHSIEAYIEEKNMDHGDKLPVIETLINLFSTTKSTLLKALLLLEEKGVIYQVRGSGIYARKRNRSGYISLLKNQGYKTDLSSERITSKVVDVQSIFPNSAIQKHLKIDSEEKTQCVKRVRYLNDEIFCYEESYFKQSIVPYMNSEIAASSIFDFIREGLGLKIGFSDMYLHVIKTTEEQAKHLDIETGDPALLIETVFHLSNGQTFDYSQIIYHYENAHFFIQTKTDFI